MNDNKYFLFRNRLLDYLLTNGSYSNTGRDTLNANEPSIKESEVLSRIECHML